MERGVVFESVTLSGTPMDCLRDFLRRMINSNNVVAF